ncbi:glycosyltransferase [Candidatus Gracilibacteria bacterium]|nr:glycosyltransferase [Candidatus Gracilibacteria bacterium]
MKTDFLNGKKIAIVCDWIKDMGGAEVVLAQLLEIFPEADIFTSIFFQKGNPIFDGKKIITSSIQNIPLLNKSHKLALTLRPKAFERFDFSGYDIVISSTTAESKGIITKPETLFICYCHTPTRYFWSHYHEYINMMEFGILNPIGKWFMPRLVHNLRKWDFLAAQRPDYFLANSKNTKNRIKKYYNREAEVVYPGIDTEKFIFSSEKKDFYLYVGRCIPYKKFDLIVDAFNKNGKKIVIITNTDNKLFRNLKNISKENISWKLNISFEEIKKYYSEAKAFLFPPEEDFGLVPIEAMASGTPVIAFGKGGALETVVNSETGVFFSEQTVESLNEAIERFEKLSFDYDKIKKHSEKFDKKYFKQNILEFIEKKIIKRRG